MSLDVGVYNIGELYKARTQGAKDKAPRKRKGEGDLQSDNWHTRTRARFKTYSDESLRFVIKDATDAAESGEKMGNPKAGQYRDEAHYAAMELASRPFKKSRTQGAKDKQPRKHRPSYDFTTGAGQKRMMYENRPNQESGVGYNPVWAKPIDVNKPGDYGADPMGEGKFRMVPSGEVVDLEERNRRLKKSDTMFVILKSWFDEVSRKQSQEDMKTLAKLKRQQWPVRRKTGLVTAHRRKTLEEKRAERAQALELRTVRDASGRATGHWSAEHRFIPAPADISHPDGGNWR
jgi:hypothetical protein